VEKTILYELEMAWDGKVGNLDVLHVSAFCLAHEARSYSLPLFGSKDIMLRRMNADDGEAWYVVDIVVGSDKDKETGEVCRTHSQQSSISRT